MSTQSLFLAQDNATAEVAKETLSRIDILHHPDILLDKLAQMPFMVGTVLVILGALCVFNGYRWHKWVVVILAFGLGLGLGQMLSEQFGRSNIVAVALGGLCAIVATPMLKIAVALFSGLTGAFIGANIWTVFEGVNPDLHWAGAAMGFIALAMTSLLLFRLMIVVFTSVGGAAMFVFGLLALLLHVEQWESGIRQSLEANQMMLPLLVGLAAVGGFVLQESRCRSEAKESEE
jgi:hypothetical protein